MEGRVRQHLVEATRLWNWRYAPRAKIAVSFRFFDQEKNHPDVHTLVKFYLDTLKGVAFHDDRQVHYLDVSTHRHRSAEHESSLFLDVWRLADYERVVQLGKQAEAPEDDRERYPPHVYLLHRDDWGRALRQHEVLAGSPVLSHNATTGLPSLMDLLRDARPLIFDLGTLPSVEGTSAFKDRVRKTMELHATAGDLLSHIYIPVELNTQVSKQAFGLAKDLDNVMQIVCPIFTQTLMHPKAYISGYRTYVIDDPDMPPRLSIQLLPGGAVEAHTRQIEARFEAYGGELEDVF
jgi:hypothetical protein